MTLGEFTPSTVNPPMARIKVLLSETRCDVCLAGSEGTCTPMTEEARNAKGTGHDWTPVTVATGYLVD